MEVLVSDTLGFCGGVHRAVDISYKTVERAHREGRRLFFYGQLVHNKSVCKWFSDNGVETILDIASLSAGDLLIVPAHGIADELRYDLSSRGVEIVDATCPVVLKGQRLIRNSDESVIVFGYKGHSEVVSLYSSGSKKKYVVSSSQDLEDVPVGRYNGVIQTTFSFSLLKEILEKAEEKGIIVNILNSVCKASIARRESVEKLLLKVDALVVVGDSNSVNTRELGAKAEKCGKPCFFVSGPDDIPFSVFSYKRVGLTAGASTPKVLYESVIKALED